ncbi:MAG: hypothetical protein NTV39_00985 [Candidatus Saccharibacteria bacterium]|nr:hypothetical protein [Candidatus Saccharibacteria bacterium]
MKNNSLNNPLKLFVDLVIRYNFVIFVVLVSTGLMASVLFLSDILNRPYSNGSKTGDSSTIFDSSTMSRLDTLQPSAKNSSYKTAPTGRANPFSE